MSSTARLFAAALLLGAAACSSDDPMDADGDGIADGVLDPNNITVVAPTKPQGFVAGTVWDATTDRPLAGATVRIVGGGIAADPVETPSSGEFSFGPISAGAAFSVVVEDDGYATAAISGLTIDDAAGNFPTINGAVFVGPIALLPTTGTFDVLVVGPNGAPVAGAEVTVQTALAFLLDGAARGAAHSSGTTDSEGRVTVEDLPNVRLLPPRLANTAGLVVRVAPTDLDDDGIPDLDGATVAISGEDVRDRALPHLVTLDAPGDGALRIVASNVAGLGGGAGAPSVIPNGEPIRVVFSEPVDRDSILVDLRNEDGTTSVTNALMVSSLGNVVTITAADPLGRGLEYNLALRAQSLGANPIQIVDIAAPFFVEETRDDPIEVLGTFRDTNGDGLWGTGSDELVLVVSSPVGRAGSNPAFRIELWVALDLNGTSTVGDGAGELPTRGELPPPILVDAREPDPGNGAGLSGYTRYITPVRLSLPFPLGQNAGSVDFEARFTPERNGGRFITTPQGRAAPARDTGTAALTSG